MISHEYIKLVKVLADDPPLFERNIDATWKDVKSTWRENSVYTTNMLFFLAQAGLLELNKRTGKHISTLIAEMIDLHKRKNAGYSGDNPDPWANFRAVEDFGISAATGVLTRLCDKYARYSILRNDPSKDKVNESLEDTLMDMVAYSLILICLLSEG